MRKIIDHIDQKHDFYITFGTLAPELTRDFSSIARAIRCSASIDRVSSTHPFRQVISVSHSARDKMLALFGEVMPQCVVTRSQPIEPSLVVGLSLAIAAVSLGVILLLGVIRLFARGIASSDGYWFATAAMGFVVAIIVGVAVALLLASKAGPPLVDRVNTLRDRRRRKELDRRWIESAKARLELANELRWLRANPLNIPIGAILCEAIREAALDPAKDALVEDPETTLGTSLGKYEAALQATSWASASAAEIGVAQIVSRLRKCKGDAAERAFRAAISAHRSDWQSKLSSLLSHATELRRARADELEELRRQARDFRANHENSVRDERTESVAAARRRLRGAVDCLRATIEQAGGDRAFERAASVPSPAPADAARFIRIGRVPMPACTWVSTFNVSLPKVPLVVPVTKCRALSVPADLSADVRGTLALELSMSIVMDNPPGEVKVVICDPAANSAALSPLCMLIRGCPVMSGSGASGVVTSFEEFEAVMRSVRSEIQQRLNFVLAPDSQIEALDGEGTRAPDRWIVVILGLPPFMSPDTVNALQALCAADRGGRAGFHVIWADDESSAGSDDLRRQIAVLRGDATRVWPAQPGHARIAIAGCDEPFMLERPEVWRGVAAHAADFRTLADRHSLRDQGFGDLMDAFRREREMRREAAGGILEIPFGFDLSGKTVKMELGRNTGHHALLIGQIGSGKSRLLQVIISAAALSYDANYLRMSIIDCKGSNDGLGPFVLGPRRLAHIDVAGLGADREFAATVLRRHVEQMRDAFRRAQENLSGSPPAMRRLIVIDEYQVLFAAEDQVASDARQALIDIATMGRSAGVHLLLCSQTTQGLAHIPQQAFSQMAVRLALRCTERDTEVMFNDPKLARRISRDQRQGLLLTGSEYAGAQPVEFLTAVIHSEKVIPDLLAGREGLDAEMSRAIVFNGERLAEFSALLHGERAGRTQELLLGMEVGLGGAARLPWVAESRWNLIAVSQPQSDAAERVMAAALHSVSAWTTAPRLIFVTGTRRVTPATLIIAGAVSSLGAEVVQVRDLPAMLKSLQEEVRLRSDAASSEGAPPIMIAIHRLDAIDCLRGPSRYDPSPAMACLDYVLSSGPSVGVHVVATSASWSEASKVLGGSESSFGHRVSARMPLEDAQSMFDAAALRTLRDDRCVMASIDRPGELLRFVPCRFGRE